MIIPMIIDFHTHIFPPEMHERREHYAQRDRTFGALYADPRARIASAEDLIATMDEDGVDVSVAMGIGWSDYGAAREANDYIIEATSRWQARIVGFAGINPAWGDRAAREAERCAAAGLRGIGELHPDTQGFDLADKSAMAELMAVAQERRLIVTTHSSEPVGHQYTGKGTVSPQVLMRFISSFPDATIVCAHWGGGLPFYALMPEVADRAAQRLFRHRRIALPLQPAGLFGSIIARRRRQGTLRQRLRPAAPPPAARRNRRIIAHPARTRSRAR